VRLLTFRFAVSACCLAVLDWRIAAFAEGDDDDLHLRLMFFPDPE
jgi:hypothetical protein